MTHCARWLTLACQEQAACPRHVQSVLTAGADTRGVQRSRSEAPHGEGPYRDMGDILGSARGW